MDIDRQLRSPPLNIHTELQLTLPTPTPTPKPPPPETAAPIPRDGGQRRHCSAQWSSRGEGRWDRCVSKSMAGAEKRLAFWQNSTIMFHSHCLISTHLSTRRHLRDVFQRDVFNYWRQEWNVAGSTLIQLTRVSKFTAACANTCSVGLAVREAAGLCSPHNIVQNGVDLCRHYLLCCDISHSLLSQ
jgi:hypothetical protein